MNDKAVFIQAFKKAGINYWESEWLEGSFLAVEAQDGPKNLGVAGLSTRYYFTDTDSLDCISVSN